MSDNRDTDNQVRDVQAPLTQQPDTEDVATPTQDTFATTAADVTRDYSTPTFSPSQPGSNPFLRRTADEMFGFIPPAAHIANVIASDTSIHAPGHSVSLLVNGHTGRFNEIHRDLEPGESLFEVKDEGRRNRILGGWGKEDKGVGVWESGGAQEEKRGKGRKKTKRGGR